MKHIVTLSLVFFSLTHLAKAERVEGLRLLTERYCNKQQTNIQGVSIGSEDQDDQKFPFFLSYSALTAIGVTPEQKIEKHTISNNLIVDLTIKEITKNNSP